MLDVIDVREDFSALAAAITPSIPLPRVKESMALLKRLGLVRRNPRGFWKPSDKIVHSGSYLKDEIVRKYQAARCQSTR
jgi:uncharacterized protein (TIGR02147 family)